MKRIPHIKTLVQGIGAYTLLSLVASFCNFLFNFTLIRLLSAEEFRDLALANNMINVFGNLFVALNIVSIAVFYMAKERQADIIRACQKVIYLLYIVLLAACVVGTSHVQQRTGLHDALILNLTLAVIFCSIPVMILNAIYLGSNRFNRSAILNVSLACGRLLLGVAGAILLATHKDAAAVGGILLVFVVVFGLFTMFEKEQYRKQSLSIFKSIWKAPIHVLRRYRLLVAASVAYAITINFLLGMDLFMFGQFFSGDQSADYAAVATVGKLIFFFVAPISLYAAAKQQELIHTRPKTALQASVGVNGLTIVASICLALLPTGLIGLVIHRPAEDINQTYLLLSLAFNASVVLVNHQIIEAIMGRRQRIVLAATATLLAINGSIFFGFRSLEHLLPTHSAVSLALGLPAVSMVLASIVLFMATHVFHKRLPTTHTER